MPPFAPDRRSDNSHPSSRYIYPEAGPEPAKPEPEMTATINVNTLASLAPRCRRVGLKPGCAHSPFRCHSLTSHIKIPNCWRARTVLIKRGASLSFSLFLSCSLAPIISEPETGFLSSIDQSFYLRRREHYYAGIMERRESFSLLRGNGPGGRSDRFYPMQVLEIFNKGESAERLL